MDTGNISKIWRIKVTNECNAKCVFCHSEGFKTEDKSMFLSVDRIVNIVNKMISYKDSVAITGGEPLLHKDILLITKLLIDKVNSRCHLNTNGILLHRYLPVLKDTGLKNIHVNLMTTNKYEYEAIYRTEYPERLWSDLVLAKNIGFTININMVVIENMIGNDDGSNTYLLKKSSDAGFNLSFIERYETDTCSDGRTFQNHYDKYLLTAGYTKVNAMPGRIMYANRSHTVRIAAPCSPAEAYDGSDALDAFVVLENGDICKFCSKNTVSICE